VIVLNVEQGSDAWRTARLGVPTASEFHRILTPRTGKLSAAADGYMAELLAEEMLGHALDEGDSQFMTRGTAMERDAVRFYEFNQDTSTERVGFLMDDGGNVGCSPDRLVGDKGGLEIKCPSAAVHVSYMLGADADKFRCQVQGALWITGRAWWDWLSFNPELPPVMIRFERDEEFITKLSTAVLQFVNYMDEARERLIGKGHMSQAVIDARATRRADLSLPPAALPFGFAETLKEREAMQKEGA